MMGNKRRLDLPAELRARLENDSALQARLDALGASLSGRLDIQIGDNEDMIDLLVTEALDGVDIRTRYPGAFESLLRDPELYDLFNDVLESFETLPDGSKDSDPATIRGPQRMGGVRTTGEGGVWQAQWQITRDILRSLFQPGETVFRDGSLDEEDRWVTLLRDEIGMGEGRAAIVLDGRFNDAGELEPELKLAFESPASESAGQLEAWGLLAWGPHRLQIAPTRAYRTRLPAIDLDEIIEPDSLDVRASLSLVMFFRTIH